MTTPTTYDTAAAEDALVVTGYSVESAAYQFPDTPGLAAGAYRYPLRPRSADGRHGLMYGTIPALPEDQAAWIQRWVHRNPDVPVQAALLQPIDTTVREPPEPYPVTLDVGGPTVRRTTLLRRHVAQLTEHATAWAAHANTGWQTARRYADHLRVARLAVAEAKADTRAAEQQRASYAMEAREAVLQLDQTRAELADQRRFTLDLADIFDRTNTALRAGCQAQVDDLLGQRDRMADDLDALRGRLQQLVDLADGAEQDYAALKQRAAQADQQRARADELDSFLAACRDGRAGVEAQRDHHRAAHIDLEHQVADLTAAGDGMLASMRRYAGDDTAARRRVAHWARRWQTATRRTDPTTED